MRLLSHNLLQCNVKGCDQNNFPLTIQVEKSQIIESEFKPETIKKLIPKLDWPALAKTVISLGDKNFPEELPQQQIDNEQFLRDVHRVLLETHIIQGKLKCENCQRVYPINNGIPNMILNDNEM